MTCEFAHDLNSIIETFDAFHKTITDLHSEKAALVESIKEYEREKREYGQDKLIHHKELEDLQNVIKEMHKRMNNNLDLAVQNKCLRADCDIKEERIIILCKEVEEIKSQHDAQLSVLKQEIAEQTQKTTKLIEELEKKKREELNMLIVTHEETVAKLQQNSSNILGKKEAEILRITMEYEDKIFRLQMQKKQQQAPPKVSLATQEIFRQKQQHMKTEYEQRMKALKQSNDQLSRRVAQLERIDTTSKLSLSSSKKRRL